MVENNKQKKRQFNIIDFTVLLVLVVVFVGFGYKFLSPDKGYQSMNDAVIESTIKIQDVREFTLKAFEVGDLVYERKGPYIGKVTKVQKMPCEKIIEKADGTQVLAEDIGKMDVYVTLEVEGKIKNGGCYAGGSRLLAAGGNLMIKSNKIECDAQVVEAHEKK